MSCIGCYNESGQIDVSILGDADELLDIMRGIGQMLSLLAASRVIEQSLSMPEADGSAICQRTVECYSAQFNVEGAANMLVRVLETFGLEEA